MSVLSEQFSSTGGLSRQLVILGMSVHSAHWCLGDNAVFASESEFISLLLPLDSKFFTYELPHSFFAVQHFTSLRIDCCSSP